MLTKTKSRNFALDLLKVFACYLVILRHGAEQFYYGTGKIEVGDDTFWIGISCSLNAICVPLFTMVTGYLILPMKMTMGDFFRRRLSRILIPFFVWYAVYSIFFIFYSGDSITDALLNFLHSPFYLDSRVGHLWYVYMLVGLYLLTPIISPWLEKASKRQLQFYLAIWLVASTIYYIYPYCPTLFAHVFFNPSPMLYYFTGMAGYFLLGYYIRRFGTCSIPVAVTLLVVGYGVAAWGFCHHMFTTDSFEMLEQTWYYGSLNIAVMTYATFCLFARIKWKGENAIGRLCTDLAKKGYGIYLFHMILLLTFWKLLQGIYPDIYNIVTGSGHTEHRILGNIPAVLIAIPIHTILTFVAASIVGKVLSYIPHANKWLGL